MERAIQNRALLKNRKVLGFLVALHVIVSVFWLFFRNFDIYSIHVLGIAAEVVWFPMILLLFFLPVVDFVLWLGDKFRWNSGFFYLLLMAAVSLLYIIFGFVESTQ